MSDGASLLGDLEDLLKQRESKAGAAFDASGTGGVGAGNAPGRSSASESAFEGKDDAVKDEFALYTARLRAWEDYLNGLGERPDDSDFGAFEQR